MPLTVGDVLNSPDGWNRSDHVVVSTAGPDVFVLVPSENLTMGSGQGGSAGDETFVEVSLL